MISPSADFDYIRQFVKEQAAVVLSDDKTYLVESRLAPILAQTGFKSLRQLVAHLRLESSKGLQQQVIEALVTTETLFFRDLYPFTALRTDIIPTLMAKRYSSRCLRLWSAGCSSGQEPYSLAMLLREHFPMLANWDVQILATDISHEMLERAQLGHYTQHEVDRGVPPELKQRYFQRQGNRWVISKAIREQVTFQQLNLATPWPTLPPVDILYLRNVLIYFSVPTKQAILARVKRCLRPDGYLFLGGGETTVMLDNAFKPVQYDKAICYQLNCE